MAWALRGALVDRLVSGVAAKLAQALQLQDLLHYSDIDIGHRARKRQLLAQFFDNPCMPRQSAHEDGSAKQLVICKGIR